MRIADSLTRGVIGLGCGGWLGLYTDGFEVREVHPETGWNALWKRVEALGILTLPESSTLPGRVGVQDGISYVVEMNDGKRYRTYCYDNPKYQKWPEAQKIIEIVKTVSFYRE